jgi:hypothetical protein
MRTCAIIIAAVFLAGCGHQHHHDEQPQPTPVMFDGAGPVSVPAAAG